MKLKITIILLLIVLSVNAQTLIPDTNFEQALIDLNIDSDGVINGQVATSDINTITFLGLGFENITDLTGIEDFSALEELSVNNNNLTSIDISQLTNLDFFDCRNNLNLTSLITSGSTALRQLICANTGITNLDLTQNSNFEILTATNASLNQLNISGLTSLTQLNLNGNNLTSINVSGLTNLFRLVASNNMLNNIITDANNTSLAVIEASGNQLTSLDVSSVSSLLRLIVDDNTNLSSLVIKNGNNSSIVTSNFSALNTTNLGCIEVDDVSYATANWTNIDAGTLFSQNCATASSNDFFINNISLYPNPTSQYLNLNLNTLENVTYAITKITGKLVINGSVSENNKISVQNLQNGVYFLRLTTNENQKILKFIKE